MVGLFCLSHWARLYLVRRLKPLPCYRRATTEPNSFEFSTAVARAFGTGLNSSLKRTSAYTFVYADANCSFVYAWLFTFYEEKVDIIKSPGTVLVSTIIDKS